MISLFSIFISDFIIVINASDYVDKWCRFVKHPLNELDQMCKFNSGLCQQV